MSIAVDRTRQRPDGHWLCMLCAALIRSKQPDRSCGAGRAHKACIVAQERRAAAASTPPARTKRPYDTLGPTQQWKRRREMRAAVTTAEQGVHCPLQAIQPQPCAAPEELLHLSTAERERIRTVASLRIPCERTMIKCKQQLATTHATETGTFAGGAYITDPVRFVSVLCAQSSFIAVGGDAGGGRCVLGVTYSIPCPTDATLRRRRNTLHACSCTREETAGWNYKTAVRRA